MEFEYVKDKLDLFPTERGKWNSIIQDWIRSDNKTLIFTCKNDKEFRNCYFCSIQNRRKNNLDYVVHKDNGKMKVYLVKA